jgi:hypothetical protein
MSDLLERDDEIGTYTRPEPTLQQECAALGEDDTLEFMNLPAEVTGIDGVIFISTDLGPHGPRVKYFEKTGKGQPSFSVTIGPEPKVVASSLPERVVRRRGPEVVRFVDLNRQLLLEFWHEGNSWMYHEVAALADRLVSIRT